MAIASSDHDVLIRVSTQLDRFERDIEEIKGGMRDMPGMRLKIDTMERDIRARMTRNNSMIIAAATVISTVVAIIAKVIVH